MPATPAGQWSYYDDRWATSRPLLGADGCGWLSVHYVSDEYSSMEMEILFEDLRHSCGDYTTVYLNWWVVVI